MNIFEAELKSMMGRACLWIWDRPESKVISPQTPHSVTSAQTLFSNNITFSGSLWMDFERDQNSTHDNHHLQRANADILSFMPQTFLMKQPHITQDTEVLLWAPSWPHFFSSSIPSFLRGHSSDSLDVFPSSPSVCSCITLLLSIIKA